MIPTNYKRLSLAFFLLISFNIKTMSQVGIGTVSPDPSSMLDIQSSTKGFLAPRMTTAEKNAIVSPTKGLMVFDNDEGRFYYYNGSDWVKIVTDQKTRDNYVLVKSIADLPNPAGNVITLVNGTKYEINGTINLGANSIDLNGCVFVGGDPNADILVYSGANGLFTGSQGGLVEFLSFQGIGGSSKLFNLNDASLSKNFIIRDSYISSFGNIGTISGHHFVYLNTLSYYGNATGSTFSGNNQLYLYDQIWNNNNTGTAFTLNGSFEFISVTGGKLSIDPGEIGIDVSSNPTISSRAKLGNLSFVNSGTYVNGAFSKEWEAEASGIDTEKDENATGSIYISSTSTTNVTGKDIPVKVSGTTSSANLFRVDTDSQDNRLRYIGTKTRFFNVIATFSMEGGRNDTIAFYIYKNGVAVPSIFVLNRIESANDIGAATIMGTVQMSTNDYVELWLENKSANEDVTIEAMNFIIK